MPIARRTLIPSAGGFFAATLTSSVSRGPGQIKTFYVNVPAGENDLDISLNAPDHSADDQVHYYLLSPADLDPAVTESGNIFATAIDTTPTPDNPTGHASLIAPDPQPGLWEVDVMQDATTDGTEFSQTVTGVVAYNQLAPVKRPVSDIDVDDHRPRLQRPDHGDGQEHDEPRRALRAATVGRRHHWWQHRHAEGVGARSHGTLTATLSPTAAAGTAVNGIVSVVDSTDPGAGDPIGFPASDSDFHDFSYAYTVGS